MYWYQILIAALIVALYEMVAHWFPWQMMLRRPLARIEAYVIGVLGFVVPISALLIIWQLYVVFLMVIILVVVAGGTVLFVNFVDYVMARLMIAHEMEERYDEEETHGRASKTRINCKA